MIGYLVIPRDHEVARYHELMRDVDASRASKKESKYTGKQAREKIQKHIVYSRNEGKLHILLESDEAEMLLDCQKESTDAVERLKNVRCLMQESLYYEKGQPMQVLRYLEADNALYHYRSSHLAAENVKISRYVLPGHQMVAAVDGLNPMFTGDASSAEFWLENNDLQFKAEDLKANFFPVRARS